MMSGMKTTRIFIACPEVVGRPYLVVLDKDNAKELFHYPCTGKRTKVKLLNFLFCLLALA